MSGSDGQVTWVTTGVSGQGIPPMPGGSGNSRMAFTSHSFCDYEFAPQCSGLASPLQCSALCCLTDIGHLSVPLRCTIRLTADVSAQAQNGIALC